MSLESEAQTEESNELSGLFAGWKSVSLMRSLVGEQWDKYTRGWCRMLVCRGLVQPEPQVVTVAWIKLYP